MRRGCKMEIKIYSTKTCGFCVVAKDYLKSKNIEFTEIDVGEDANAANEMVKKTSQMGVPVIEMDGEFIIGFDKEAIDKKLRG